jgi:tRNA(Ile)-lysidine synthase TilS/MesJ
MRLYIVDIQDEYGASLPQFTQTSHQGRIKPCSVYGLIKRHVMNGFGQDYGYDVLASGHNQDDEAAVFFGNTLSWAGDYLFR